MSKRVKDFYLGISHLTRFQAEQNEFGIGRMMSGADNYLLNGEQEDTAKVALF